MVSPKTNTKSKWRRFRPRTRGSLDDKTAYEPESLYGAARQLALTTYRHARPKLTYRSSAYRRSATAVRYLKRIRNERPEYNLALLILQAPGAARAQREMDSRHGGYRNREARVFELIDFNDTFVDTVLELDQTERAGFVQRCKIELDYFCQQIHTAMFSDSQFEAIVHGLSREIAVYLAALELGYDAQMASRVQDAMGVDMVITDPTSGKSINIDVKTHSSFHFRLIDLERQNRLNEEQRLQCELSGYCLSVNGRGNNAVETILFRVATDKLGPINDFVFHDIGPIATLLASAVHDHGYVRSNTVNY